MKLRIKESGIGPKDVKVGLYRSHLSGTPFSSGEFRLYLSDRMRKNELLCRSIVTPSVKYELEGEEVSTLFYGMLWNSEVGWIYNDLFRKDKKLTLNQILSLPFPDADEVETASGALLESYIIAIDNYLNKHTTSDEARGSLTVTSEFLTRLRNYYVSQLYIPAEFKRKGIDIVGRWEEVIGRLPDATKEGRGMIDLLLVLIKTIVRENIGLLKEFNKMKVYQLQISREIRTHISRLRALQILHQG